jgi:hypothetical protein
MLTAKLYIFLGEIFLAIANYFCKEASEILGEYENGNSR